MSQIQSPQKPVPKDVQSQVTSAWLKAKPICLKFLEDHMTDESSKYLRVPPNPEHPCYAEMMHDYSDLSVVLTKLKRGQISGIATFNDEIARILQKHATYMKADTSKFNLSFQDFCRQVDNIPLKLYDGNKPTASFQELRSVLSKYASELRKEEKKVEPPIAPPTEDKPMAIEQRFWMAVQMRKMSPSQIDFIASSILNERLPPDQKWRFDVTKLSDADCWKILRFINECRAPPTNHEGFKMGGEATMHPPAMKRPETMMAAYYQQMVQRPPSQMAAQQKLMYQQYL